MDGGLKPTMAAGEPRVGSGSANLSISVVSVGGLPVGSTVTGAITLTLMGASNTAGPITVSLTLIPTGTTARPFGFVDTPLDNTTGATGAIPFTVGRSTMSRWRA